MIYNSENILEYHRSDHRSLKYITLASMFVNCIEVVGNILTNMTKWCHCSSSDFYKYRISNFQHSIFKFSFSKGGLPITSTQGDFPKFVSLYCLSVNICCIDVQCEWVLISFKITSIFTLHGVIITFNFISHRRTASGIYMINLQTVDLWLFRTSLSAKS